MREFSEESRQYFYDIIDEVNDSDWCAATDCLGDLLEEYGWVVGYAKLAQYYDSVDEYWIKLLDKNNAEKGEIAKVFEKVQEVDEDYESKFSQYIEPVTAQIKLIKSLGEIVQPEQGNFTIDKINEKAGVASKEIIEIYVNRAKKDGVDGEYDFEYIKEFFNRNPDEITEYEYIAMILVYNEMSNDQKEMFIESAYRDVGTYFGDNHCDYNDYDYYLCDNYITMMEYYDGIINGIDESCLDKDSPYYENTMKTINDYSILCIFRDCTPEIHTNFVELDIQILNRDIADLEDYEVYIDGGNVCASEDNPQKYIIYSMSKSDWAFDESTKYQVERLKVDIEEKKKQDLASWLGGVALGFLDIGPIDDVISVLSFEYSLCEWLNECDEIGENNDKCDKVIEGTEIEQTLKGLNIRATVVVGDNGECKITKSKMNEELLNENIKDYNEACEEHGHDSQKLNATAEDIKDMIYSNKNISDIDNLNLFMEWNAREGKTGEE